MKYIPEHNVHLDREAAHLGVDLERYTFVQCARLKAVHILPAPEVQGELAIHALCGKDGESRGEDGFISWAEQRVFCGGDTHSICNKCLKAAKQKEVKPKDGFAPYVQTDGTAHIEGTEPPKPQPVFMPSTFDAPLPLKPQPRVAAKRGRRRLECPKELEPLVGVVGDLALANRAGVSHAIARRWRTERGIKPYRLHSNPHPRKGAGARKELVGRLGTTTDAILSEEYGLSRERIRQLRVKNGIKRFGFDSSVLPEEAVSELGTDTDIAIAKKYGFKAEFVGRERRERGIEKYERYKKALAPFIDLLGTVPDSEIASVSGAPWSAVRAERVKRKIDPHSHNGRAKLDAEKIHQMWCGGLSDKEIAAAVGSKHPGSIAQVRRRNGWYTPRGTSDD